ncbi:hypothetical protein PYK79_16050 [Streptomyces sp. ID05-04B]|uniref:hypothetical protein n=1 Tax=unclassified Streptomyces TaxID=2593676 RepID=UPI0020B1752E|nr:MULTISPECIES: hypothetical protein [unclassified Streptomyces]MDX5564559.1 hypothetical protein [Streptomyces sp. ID05-04B]
MLAGTDSHPCGTVADEVAWLHRCGVPAEDALAAAAWRARAWLGLPSLTDGAPADLVAYDTDPTLTPQAIPHPSRIILRGRIVR